MGTEPGSRSFRRVGVALIRATADEAGQVLPPWPAADGTQPGPWVSWIGGVWDHAEVAQAVGLASPTLAARIDAVRDGGSTLSLGQARRLALALARYLVRMRGRATPFGLFSGVAPLRFCGRASVEWTGGHRVRVGADAAWLSEVITGLESAPGVREHLFVTVNNLAFVRGDRLVVPWQPPTCGTDRPAELSVRCTPAVRAVLRAARVPLRWRDLADMLAREFPGYGAQPGSFVGELVSRGVLITSLRPSSTSTDGLGHVLCQLAEATAAGTRDVTLVERALRAIHGQMREAEVASRAVLAAREIEPPMRAVRATVDSPVMIDLRLGLDVTLPPQVAREAEAAASVLARLSPRLAGDPSWREYRDRFLERYGTDMAVAVNELTDPIAGLGFPAHFDDTPRHLGEPGITPRDLLLLALAQQAALDGQQEVVLDDAQVSRIAEAQSSRTAACHGEVCADIRASSLAALDDGAFLLGVNGVSRSAIAMSGRFITLLPGSDQAEVMDAVRRLPASVEGAVLAQLSFPPRRSHLENVARVPAILPRVPLAEPGGHGGDAIPLSDLAIVASDDRLHVVSLSRGRVVEPVLVNAVALQAMPPLARLLAEIPRAWAGGLSPFSWGPARCLPFLPRVRYGRSILVPARWRLPDEALPRPGAPMREWASALAGLRDRLRLPGTVHAGDGDHQLRLCLDEPMDVAVLRAHLDRAPDPVVTEAPSPSEHGWLGGRAHEVVIPVASTAPPLPCPRVTAALGRFSVPATRGGMLPGSDVLYARLYAHPDLFDTILTGHLYELLAEWGRPPRWWFVRYRDPRPHLRLRLHLDDQGEYGNAAIRVGRWATGLRQRGLAWELSLDTYHPETARYGDGAAMTAAEALFAADSAAAVAQIKATAGRAPDARAITAASMADLTAAMNSGGMRWLIDHVPRGGGHPDDRAAVRRAAELSDTGLAALPAGHRVWSAWRDRRETVAVYRQCLASAPHLPADMVLTSLLHMHHNRAHGVVPGCEGRCHRVARAVALAHAARQPTADGGHR